MEAIRNELYRATGDAVCLLSASRRYAVPARRQVIRTCLERLIEVRQALHAHTWEQLAANEETIRRLLEVCAKVAPTAGEA